MSTIYTLPNVEPAGSDLQENNMAVDHRCEQKNQKDPIVYKIFVATGKTMYVYYTNNSDIFHNFIRGNEPMILFKTTCGKQVALPPTFLISQKECKK